jgi:hypothetical protein
VIYLGYAYTQMPLVTFTREVIESQGQWVAIDTGELSL